MADVELDVSALDPSQRVEAVGLAPVEPAAQLERVQLVGMFGVAGEEGDRGQLGRDISVGWKGRNVVVADMGFPRGGTY